MVLLFNFNDYQRSSFFSSSNRLCANIYNMGNGITQYFGLRDANLRLSEENTRLCNRIDYLEQQLHAITDTLPHQFILDDERYFTYTTGNVINSSTNRSRNFLTADVGKTAGVRVHINAVGKKGTMVYYSTDGSDPAGCATPVTDSISFVVHETTTVRAYAYDASTEQKTAEQTAVYTYKEPQTGPITVNFIKPRAWETLYLYAFTRVKVDNKYKDTPYSLDGKSPKWPGMEWTQTTTLNDSVWHTWTMSDKIKEDVKDKDFYVIFTEGDHKPQTQDIYLTESTCFVWRADCGKAVVSPDCDGKTDIEEIIAETKTNNDTYKIVTDDRLVIIRDGVMYDVLGRRL